MRQISTRICVSRERLRDAIFPLMKKTATRFHQSVPVCIKQIKAGEPSSGVVWFFKISFTIKWKLMIAEEVLSKPFLFWLKKQLSRRFTHRLYVCLFLSEDSAYGF